MVFFNIKDNVRGFRHQLLFGLRRSLFNLPADHFIGTLNNLGYTCEPIKTTSGAPVVCHICGFSIATASLKEGWHIQACSAVNFERAMKKSDFNSWVETLPDIARLNASEAQATTSQSAPDGADGASELPVLKANNLPIRLFNNILS